MTIDGNGDLFFMGLGDLPNTVRFFAGDVSPDGSEFYLNLNGGGLIYTVSLPNLAQVHTGSGPDGFPQIIEINEDSSTTICTPIPANPCGRVADWAAHPTDGLLYGGNDLGGGTTTGQGLLAILDPMTGTRTD